MTDLKTKTARRVFGIFLAAGCISGSLLAQQQPKVVDPAEIEQLLTTAGLEGEIHGSVADLNLFAFTYRAAASFFSFAQMSLVARDPGVSAQLAGFKRHDRVRVRGSFLPNPSGQRHILVTSVELVRAYTPAMAFPLYDREAVLNELQRKNRDRFLVHIADESSGILVVEYRDAIVPVFVRKTDLLKGLYRNDVVELRFRVQSGPSAPVHLNLDESDARPLRVVDSIRGKHGKRASMEGALVMFPQSPQIRFNVFALLEKLPSGLTRQYTLANVEDAAAFTKIRDKLQAAWDGAGAHYENGRNKLVSRTLRVRATGVFNQTDPGQANPQILLESADDIRIR